MRYPYIIHVISYIVFFAMSKTWNMHLETNKFLHLMVVFVLSINIGIVIQRNSFLKEIILKFKVTVSGLRCGNFVKRLEVSTTAFKW